MEIIDRQCPICERIYQVNASRLKHGRGITCSKECKYKHTSKITKKTIEMTCATCGKKVNKVPSTAKRRKHGSVFCSRQCHYKGRSLGHTKRIVSKPYVFTEEGKARQKSSELKSKGKRKFHPMVCSQCNKNFECPNWGRKRKSGNAFCSLECCNKYRKGENNPAWRGGHPKYYGSDWRSARKAARIRDDYKCRRCGKRSSRNPDVHHIIPVINFEDPNDAHYLANLVCLCQKCHKYVEWNGIDF